MDLVSPHVKLGPVTINNQAVFINIYIIIYYKQLFTLHC